ncbi:Glycosyl transferase [Macleaya cordata]|uniref:Glycosyl transferase n=1 Tax=Macleaya cordata TaxID=56857 RepID=A0A200PNC5_MACCD|nr:Glycosyl transferase [Macleaya cordata]
MEERRDFQGNVGRPSSLRPSGSLKSTLSGKSTPRGSPSFRRLHSSRTPRRDGRGDGGRFQWFRGNKLLLWLLLITLWAYLGFYVQSKWAHGHNDKEELIGYRSKASIGISDTDQNKQPDLIKKEKFVIVNNNSSEDHAGKSKNVSNSKNIDVMLTKKSNGASSRKSNSSRKTKRSTSARRLRSKNRGKEKVVDDGRSSELVVQEEEIPKRNTSYGLLVGPFGLTEDNILGWNAEKRSGTCDRKGEFARIVWSRKFVLIFHELSMTGAPLSMMELATELLSCGATVSAVVLSKRGGLMGELTRRRIKVVEDKAELSYKTAMKADLVIAGSAICSQWIEQYLAHFKAGSNQIAWWIMENRREYFDRAKPMLNRVKLLIFLSETQSKQWLAWCEEEGIKLNSPPALMPLAVNDELAFVAGIPCSLNTPSFTVETMLERRRLLRDAVRKEMGLTDKDMLVMSLSSINPGKGQFLLLESARLTIEQNLSLEDSGSKGSGKEGNVSDITVGQEDAALSDKQHSRALFQNLRTGESANETKIKEVLSDNEETKEPSIKVLIGSVGSKSNKVPYVKGLLRFLSQHPRLSKLVLWTPATTRVTSLYSAADAYVINSQGLGETFGRVTIEAMAFGLPVLGTEAGGTKEIVEHNVTGLLHPLGRPGTKVLAQNLLYLLNNPSEREKMGMRGKSKVERMFLKTHMYEKFAFVLFKCMRIK